ncbi:hypothetical protein GWK47_051966 [Chionoecetes opilio]|uniref:Uncharacterized protein n=1 Tax=Chionoecetes opilio TaxID=41210 RepID=A0A8J4YC92_CHIOP|nr:hypothetical protein GWK47_051966 [Chionoecetes opilio]
MLREVCRDVTTEPTLLPLNGEHVSTGRPTPQRGPSGRKCSWFLDQRTESVHGHQNLRSNGRLLPEDPTEAAHQKNERKKSGVMEIGSECRPRQLHTPGFHYVRRDGPQAKCFYSRLADVMAERSTSQGATL